MNPRPSTVRHTRRAVAGWAAVALLAAMDADNTLQDIASRANFQGALPAWTVGPLWWFADWAATLAITGALAMARGCPRWLRWPVAATCLLYAAWRYRFLPLT